VRGEGQDRAWEVHKEAAFPAHDEASVTPKEGAKLIPYRLNITGTLPRARRGRHAPAMHLGHRAVTIPRSTHGGGEQHHTGPSSRPMRRRALAASVVRAFSPKYAPSSRASVERGGGQRWRLVGGDRSTVGGVPCRVDAKPCTAAGVVQCEAQGRRLDAPRSGPGVYSPHGDQQASVDRCSTSTSLV
jgi:hypothetical protein